MNPDQTTRGSVKCSRLTHQDVGVKMWEPISRMTSFAVRCWMKLCDEER